MYGPAQTTTGGNALKFYSSVRIDISPSTMIKDSDDKPIGRIAKVKVVKNKVAPPFKKAEFDIMFGEGISKSGEIIEMGVEYGVIKKSGAWFSYDGSKLGQGKEAVRRVIADNPELMAELEEKVRKAFEEELANEKNKAFNPFISSNDNSSKLSGDDDDADEFSVAADREEDYFEEDIEIDE